MTFSIVARDGEAFGVAVASKFPFVGAVVPEVRFGLGAVATQALAKVGYRATALDALADGGDAGAAVAACTEPDDDRDDRQLGVVGVASQATWTGSRCLPWAGGVARPETRDGVVTGGYAIQGNILVGPEVVESMERAWLASAGRPFADRLVAALLAGDDAGGDSRGRQGAALYAVSPGAGYDRSGVLADIRVDDHPQAPRELARLVGLNALLFGAPEEVQPLEGPLGAEVGQRLAALGFTGDPVAVALEAWASRENYESRLSPDGIDVRVLAALREATADTAQS
jgi:uncharacterized Ntn-hydrolase superfamily protein